MIVLFVGVLAFAPARADAPSPCAYLAGLVPAEGGPLFLPSYPTVEAGPLKGAAFLYDNAAATIALVGCGDPGRARRIGDAILLALDHDRAWHDGRLRNAYAAGPVVNGPVIDGPVKLGGWWDDGQGRWLEDAYQVGSDSGNLAWAMMALLTLDRTGEDSRYRAGAIRIAEWLAGRADERGAGGFTGGDLGWEPAPEAVTWKSTEHNTDLAAAFSLLAVATGDKQWTERADQAGRFVRAMWGDADGAFATGTGTDGITRNTLLALDANVWPLLALPGLAALHGAAVTATVNARLRSGGGYSYSEAGPGVWIEGTGQTALLEKLLGHTANADALIQTIDAARAPGGGWFATLRSSVATGFADAANPKVERYYLHLPHLAAAAWAALAEQGFNPFTGTPALPPDPAP
jgi:hypothetical protein